MTFHLLYSLFVHIRSKSYATKITLVYNLLRSLVVCLGLIEVYHIICIIQVLYCNELTHTVNEIWKYHYNDVIMTTIASQITSLTVVYSTVYSDADQRKHQSSASLAFVWGIHRDRWIPSTNGQLRGKCFHLMTSSHFCNILCIIDNVWPLNDFGCIRQCAIEFDGLVQQPMCYIDGLVQERRNWSYVFRSLTHRYIHMYIYII